MKNTKQETDSNRPRAKRTGSQFEAMTLVKSKSYSDALERWTRKHYKALESLYDAFLRETGSNPRDKGCSVYEFSVGMFAETRDGQAAAIAARKEVCRVSDCLPIEIGDKRYLAYIEREGDQFVCRWTTEGAHGEGEGNTKKDARAVAEQMIRDWIARQPQTGS